jgi:hypothetical protein
MDAAGSDPAVSLKQRNPIPRSHWHCRLGSRGFNDTAESASAVSLRLRNFFLQKCPSRIPQSHREGGIRTLQTIISTISANTKPYAKRLQRVNQSPRGIVWWKNRRPKISRHCHFKWNDFAVILHKMQDSQLGEWRHFLQYSCTTSGKFTPESGNPPENNTKSIQTFW